MTLNGIFISDRASGNSIDLINIDPSFSTTINGAIWSLGDMNSATSTSEEGGNATLIINGEAQAFTGGDPHCICLDGSRLDIYEPGFYQMCQFEELDFNVEVARDNNYLDYYKQAYIQHDNTKITVEFTPWGLQITTDSDTISGLSQWSHTYCYRNAYITMCFESAYNSISIKTNKIGSVKIGGIYSGEIVLRSDIADVSRTDHKFIQTTNYDSNALLCGSTDSYVVTIQGKQLKVSEGYYRLVQFGSNIVNCYLNSDRQIKQLQIFTTDGLEKNWIWSDDEHWNLKCYSDGIPVDKFYKQDIILHENKSQVLMRIQANGSVSAGFTDPKSYARGLFTDDILSVDNIQDQKIYTVGELSKSLTSNQQAGIYERNISKYLASSN
jgi:hypothetical protein